MMEQNNSRVAFTIRLQKIVGQYNSGVSSVENYYKSVRSTVSEVLNGDLSESYDRTLFQKKCDNVYDLIYNLSATSQRWAA